MSKHILKLIESKELTLKRYISERKSTHFVHKGIEVMVKDPLPANVDINKAMNHITSIVPLHLMGNIKNVNVGQFKQLLDREIQALYKDSSVFVTNNQRNEMDIVDDIIHEVAHSVEETHQELIYKDGKIKAEFAAKRKNLWRKLSHRGFEKDIGQFLNLDYETSFDEFLFYDVGYPILSTMTSDMFNSPYAATSVREYFANGFESFFLKQNLRRLKSISPELYKKMGELLNVKYNSN